MSRLYRGCECAILYLHSDEEITLLQPNGPAPYTSASAAIIGLEACRERGLGSKVSSETLTRAGVPETISNRTFQSYRVLGLLEGDGTLSEQWETLRTARGEDEYQARLQEWLRGVYADVLQYADPSTHSLERITEAFRSYEPAGQRRAMAALLVGLWRYAGLPVADGSTHSSASLRPPPGRRVAVKRVAARGGSSASSSGARKSAPASDDSALPPGLVGLLQQVPTGGRGWSQETRDNFVRAFTAVLDFTVPVTPAGLEDLGMPSVADDHDPEDFES